MNDLHDNYLSVSTPDHRRDIVNIWYLNKIYYLCQLACQYGYLDCLQYIYEHGYPLINSTCSHAASGGHLDCLRYAHEHGCPLTDVALEYADSHGYLDCSQYVREYIRSCGTIYDAIPICTDDSYYAHTPGYPWDEMICEYTVRHGHFDGLKYAHEHGFSWNESICSYAALWGRLNCLQYAHEHGCPWNEKTCEYAAICGRLNCLKYALVNGCSYNKSECIRRSNDPDSVKRIFNELGL